MRSSIEDERVPEVRFGFASLGVSARSLVFLARTQSLRRLIGAPIRTGMVILAVAIGVALFLASVMAGEASVSSFAASSSGATKEGVLTIHSRIGSLTEKDVAAITVLGSDRYRVIPVVEFLATHAQASVRIFGLDANLFGGNETGVMLPEGSPFIEELPDLSSITLVADGVPITLPVSVVKHPLLSQKHAVYLDLSLLEKWLPHRSFLSGAYLVPQEDEVLSKEYVEEITQALRVQNPLIVVESDADHASRMESLLGAFRMNVLVMILMTLFVTGLLVENAMRVHAFHSMKEVQILRALGVTGKGAALLLLIDSVIIGFVGTLVGMLGGYPLVVAVSALLMRTAQEMYLPDLTFAALGVGGWTVVYAVTFATGMIVSVAGGLFPALQARSVAPVLTGRPDALPIVVNASRQVLLVGVGIAGVWGALLGAWHREQIGLAYLAVLLLVAVSYLLVSLSVHRIVRSLGRTIKRVPRIVTLLAAGSSEIGEKEVARSVRTMAAGLALLIGLSILVTSFRTSLQEWVAFTFSSDLFIKPVAANDPRNPAVLSPAAIEQVRRIAGVGKIFRTRGYLEDIEGAPISLYGVELPEGDQPKTMQFLAGRYDTDSFAAGKGVLLSESAARRLKRQPGDVVEVLGRSLPVLALFRDYTRERGTILIGWQPFESWTNNAAAESITVDYAPGFDRGKVRAAVEQVFSADGVSVLSTGELRERIDELFRSTFAITGVLRGIILIVSLAGFLIASIQRYAAREAELQTLRALGVTRRELGCAAAIEGVMAVVPAVVVGGIAGGILGWILIAYVNPLSFGWSLSIHLDWQEGITAAAIFMVLAALCSAMAAVGVYRQSARGGWRDE